MKEYQKRVLEEKSDLDSKLFRLDRFIESDVFKTLDGEEKDRMMRQASIMRAYSSLLKERIDAFNTGNPTNL